MEQGADLRMSTFGEKFIGTTFNPSGVIGVSKIKDLYAEVADIIAIANNNKFPSGSVKSEIEELLYNKALSDLLTAQMSAVKYLTFNN